MTSSDDRLVPRSVNSATLLGRCAIPEIQPALANSGGIDPSSDHLPKTLEQLEQTGVLESSVTDVFGTPYYTWKLKNGADKYLRYEKGQRIRLLLKPLRDLQTSFKSAR